MPPRPPEQSGDSDYGDAEIEVDVEQVNGAPAADGVEVDVVELETGGAGA